MNIFYKTYGYKSLRPTSPQTLNRVLTDSTVLNNISVKRECTNKRFIVNSKLFTIIYVKFLKKDQFERVVQLRYL